MPCPVCWARNACSVEVAIQWVIRNWVEQESRGAPPGRFGELSAVLELDLCGVTGGAGWGPRDSAFEARCAAPLWRSERAPNPTDESAPRPPGALGLSAYSAASPGLPRPLITCQLTRWHLSSGTSGRSTHREIDLGHLRLFNGHAHRVNPIASEFYIPELDDEPADALRA